MATATELRDAVVATFLGEVGYTSGTYTDAKYCYAKSWRSDWLGGVKQWSGLYCDRSYSWSFDQVLGAKAGVAAIGLQGYAIPVGFAATWLHREWFLANDRHVGFANSQPGDAFLFKLPGRPKNPTNHIGMFYKWHIPGKVAITIEGNLPHPVTRTTASIGVHLHYRDITYVVGVYRPDWDAATAIYNTENPTEEDELSAAEVQEIKDHIDVLRRERTNAHVKELANQEAILRALAEIRAKQDDLRNGINVVGRVAAEARDGQPTVEEIVKGVYTDTAQGMSRDWWNRNGLILDKDHRQYPADPGSLADFIIRTFEQVTGEVAEVYDGTQKRPIGPGEPHGTNNQED